LSAARQEECGQNDHRLRHEKTDGEFQRAKHLARGGLTNIQVPPVREIPKRKMPLSSELRFWKF
jgi:hypothetical protein